nr:SWI/SNF complex subunit SWI3D isoform X1 [Ipomoea batatas]
MRIEKLEIMEGRSWENELGEIKKGSWKAEEDEVLINHLNKPTHFLAKGQRLEAKSKRHSQRQNFDSSFYFLEAPGSQKAVVGARSEANVALLPRVGGTKLRKTEEVSIEANEDLEGLEAKIEAEFDAIRSQEANAHVVPSHVGEFKILFTNAATHDFGHIA